MSMFDRIRGLGKKTKGESSVSSSEDSFDLDDDALFGSGADSDEGALGTMDEFGGDEGMETFGTLAEDEGDLGAAGTADFEGFDDLGDSLGGESFGDDFGDAALDVAEPTGGKGKKGKKAKKKKAKKPRVAGRPGRGKVIGITVGVAVGAVVVGMLAGPLLVDTVTGKRKMEAELADTQLTLKQAKQKLAPLERSATPEQVEALQTDLAARQERLQSIATIEAKVADLADQEAGREDAFQRRDASIELLAVRSAALGNISKQGEQMQRRVANLQARGAQMEEETAALDDQVRTLQADLPAAYTDAATAEATRTLSIQASLGAGPAAPE